MARLLFLTSSLQLPPTVYSTIFTCYVLFVRLCVVVSWNRLPVSLQSPFACHSRSVGLGSCASSGTGNCCIHCKQIILIFFFTGNCCIHCKQIILIFSCLWTIRSRHCLCWHNARILLWPLTGMYCFQNWYCQKEPHILEIQQFTSSRSSLCKPGETTDTWCGKAVCPSNI